MIERGQLDSIFSMRIRLAVFYGRWLDDLWRWRRNRGPAAGMIELLFRLCEPRYDFDPEEVTASLSNSMARMRQDWFFLDILAAVIARSDAGNKSLVQTIDHLAREIRDEWSGYGSPDAMLNLVIDGQRKTDELYRSEIEGALQVLSSITVSAGSPDSGFWDDFVPNLGKNFQSFRNTGHLLLHENLQFLHKELLSIHRYLDGVQNGLSPGLRSNPRVDGFLVHVASVVLNIAVKSTHFWFNSSRDYRVDALTEAQEDVVAALVDLNREIDPTNLVFIGLNLRFHESLYKLSLESDSVAQFCSYLLFWVGSEQLRKELTSLLTLFFTYKKPDGDSLIAEIEALLGEAAFSHRDAASLPCPDDDGLLTKLGVLKAELLLKMQLHARTPSLDLTNLRPLLTKEAVDDDELVSEIDFLQSRGIPLDKPSILQLLFKILFTKAEALLATIVELGDQVQSLGEHLNYLKRIITNKLSRDTSQEERVIRKVEAFVRGITILSYSFLPENQKLEKIIHSLPHLLDEAIMIKTKVEEMNHQFPSSIFPKTYQLGFVQVLHKNLRQLLQYDPESIAPVRHHIEEAIVHLQSFLSANLKHSDAELPGELKDAANRIIQAAYKLEYVVQSIEVDGHFQQSLWLYDILEDMRRQVRVFHDMYHVAQILPSARMVVQADTSAAAAFSGILIDLSDEEMAVVERLTWGSAQRDVVSIAGMPGIGKTTLARKVFNHRNVMSYFRRRAWCTVSQTYSRRMLLLELLSHMPFVTENLSQLTDDDLLSKLRRSLLGNRYLIVMDDVWDTAAWNDLGNCFPDNGNGSRILITSRLRDVVSKIKPGSDPHSIRPFSDDESWMLLEKRVFKGAVCPGELLEVGKEIARHCQGLPLAVIAVAGVLQRIESSADSWRGVLKGFDSGIINSPENRCREILELSYKHLPEKLKVCFLYLGVFLGDRDIPVKKLMRFWMAEGFIQETELKSSEEVAEDYLLQLINRSLVNVHERRSNGKAKTCRLHDLLRDLCHLKAKEDDFLQPVISRQDEACSDYGSEFDHGMEKQLGPTPFTSYRLSFFFRRRHFVDSTPSSPGARSLTFFASSDSEPKCPYDISFICHNFKLLWILDLEQIMATGFPVEIGLMVQLRYLGVSGYMQCVPPSIANLWRLETLIVKGLRGKVVLPQTIWSMVSLRYIRVNNHVAFSTHDEPDGKWYDLPNLVSFSTPCLSCEEEGMLSILKRFPNLRELRCVLLRPWDSSEDSGGFLDLGFLTHLESLKIIYHGRPIYSGEPALPSSLKKLTLSNFCMQENHLSVIGELPRLCILKLVAGTFEEQKWVMKEEEFKELTFLELDSMDIVQWDASDDHIPCLERLVLRNCKALEEIPSDFANICTLKMVEVQWCTQSVVESAEVIQDTTEGIEVLITRV